MNKYIYTDLIYTWIYSINDWLEKKNENKRKWKALNN